MLKFAIDLAKKAGDKALKNLDKSRVRSKKDYSPVTNIDIKIEKFIISNIAKKYPKHNIISEETGNIDKGSDYTWIIDPIDGTRAFAKGVKQFGVSIALYHRDKPVLGVIYGPCTKDIYYALKGKGAFCNNKKLRVSNRDKLFGSTVVFTSASLINEKPAKHKIIISRLSRIIKSRCRIRLTGGPFSLCYLAQGLYDIYFDLTGNEKVWDKAAGLIIAKEAGAKITGLDGKPCSIDDPHIVVSNGKIHKQFLNLL